MLPQCPVCWHNFVSLSPFRVVIPCGHVVCGGCMSELIERGLRCPYRCTETTLDWDVTDSFIVESVLPEAKVFDGVTISTGYNERKMVAACVRADTASLKKDIDNLVDKLNNQGKTVERLEQRIVRDRVAAMQVRDQLHSRRELLFQRMDQVCDLEKKLQLASERYNQIPESLRQLAKEAMRLMKESPSRNAQITSDLGKAVAQNPFLEDDRGRATERESSTALDAVAQSTIGQTVGTRPLTQTSDSGIPQFYDPKGKRRAVQ